MTRQNFNISANAETARLQEMADKLSADSINGAEFLKQAEEIDGVTRLGNITATKETEVTLQPNTLV